MDASNICSHTPGGGDYDIYERLEVVVAGKRETLISTTIKQSAKGVHCSRTCSPFAWWLERFPITCHRLSGRQYRSARGMPRSRSSQRTRPSAVPATRASTPSRAEAAKQVYPDSDACFGRAPPPAPAVPGPAGDPTKEGVPDAEAGDAAALAAEPGLAAASLAPSSVPSASAPKSVHPEAACCSLSANTPEGFVRRTMKY